MPEPGKVQIIAPDGRGTLWTGEDQVPLFERKGWTRAASPVDTSRATDLLAAVAAARGRDTPTTTPTATPDLRAAVRAARES